MRNALFAGLCVLLAAVAPAEVLERFSPRPDDVRRSVAADGPIAIWQRGDRLVEHHIDGRERRIHLLPVKGVIGLVARCADTNWFVDPESGAVWRLDASTWTAVARLNERVAAAGCSGPDTLLVNTPDAPGSALRLVTVGAGVDQLILDDPDDAVGAARTPLREFVLSRSGDGSEMLAWARYDNRLVRLTRDGRVLMDSPSPAPRAGRGVAVRRSDPDACCMDIELVTQTHAGAGQDGRVAVVGRSPDRLLFFDRQMRLEHEVSIAALPDDIAVAKNAVLAIYTDRVEVVRLPQRPHFFRVLDEGAGPVGSARLEIRSAAGAVFVATTDAAGIAAVRGIGEGVGITGTASADGFMEERFAGTIEEVARRPITLKPRTQACVDLIAPIAPKEVTLAALSHEHSGARAAYGTGPRRTLSVSATGTFCFEVDRALPQRYEIRAGGYAPARLVVDEPRQRLTVELVEDARLRVTLRDPDDAPVPGAMVRLLTSSEAGHPGQSALPSERHSDSDESGMAILQQLTPGEWVLDVRAKGYVAEQRQVTLHRGENELAVTLSRGSTLEVSVVDASSRPVEGIRAFLEAASADTGERSCVTDSGGECTISGIVAGILDVRAAPSSGISRVHRLRVDGSSTYPVRLTIEQGGELTGRVRGTEEWSGRLTVHLSAASLATQQVSLDADGRFRFANVPHGDVGLWVSSGEDGTLYSQRHQIPQTSRHALEIQLPKPVTVRGRIEVEGGAACGTCAASFQETGAHRALASAHARTDGFGGYVVKLRSPGRWIATVRDEATGDTTQEVLDLSGDMRRDLRLERAALTVAVVDVRGAPASAARVRVTGRGSEREEIADADGVAHFRGIASGDWTATAVHGRATAQGNVTVETRSARITLRLKDGQVVRIRPIDAASGAAIGRLTASVTTARRHIRYSDLPAAGGVVEIPMPEESGLLVVGAPGMGLEAVGAVRVGDPVRPVLLRRDGLLIVDVAESVGAACSFALRNGEGAFVPLSLDLPIGPVPIRVGQFTFSGVPPGNYTAELTLCDGRVERAAVVPVSGRHLSVSFGMP
jgi:hypothetical protein